MVDSNTFRNAVDTAVKQQLNAMFGMFRSTEPQFSLRKFEENERLIGRKNFKPWRSMIEMELRAFGLLKYIESDTVDSSISQERREIKGAQTLMYIRGSVSKNISQSLNKITSPYEAFQTLITLYGENELLDAVELLNRFDKLKYQPGFSQIRYVTEYESIVNEYRLRETSFDEMTLKALFLQRLVGIKDPSSPLFTFFNTITVLPQQSQSLETIKKQFLALDLTKTPPTTERSFQDRCKTDNRDFCSFRDSRSSDFRSTTYPRPSTYDSRKRPSDNTDTQTRTKIPRLMDHKAQIPTSFSQPNTSKSNVTVIPGSKPNYTREQYQQLKNMTAEQKREIQCGKCNQYFHKDSECPNPGKQCYNCSNFCHVQSECPFPPQNSKPRNSDQKSQR